MSKRYSIPPEPAGFGPLLDWLARMVVAEAIAEQKLARQPTKDDDHACGDLRPVQQREAV